MKERSTHSTMPSSYKAYRSGDDEKQPLIAASSSKFDKNETWYLTKGEYSDLDMPK